MEKMTTTQYRDSFVARFGEDDAARIEAAAESHLTEWESGIHDDDDRGEDPFQYLFLTAIAWECVSRYREPHGIVATTEAMRDWALTEGNLGAFTGTPPDYLALFCGAYTDWIKEEEKD